MIRKGEFGGKEEREREKSKVSETRVSRLVSLFRGFTRNLEGVHYRDYCKAIGEEDIVSLYCTQPRGRNI
jgi:hypothetical protein